MSIRKDKSFYQVKTMFKDCCVMEAGGYKQFQYRFEMFHALRVPGSGEWTNFNPSGIHK